MTLSVLREMSTRRERGETEKALERDTGMQNACPLLQASLLTAPLTRVSVVLLESC